MKLQKSLMATTNNQGTNRSTKKKTTRTTNSQRKSKAERELGREPLLQEEVIKLVNSTETLEDRTLLVLGFTTGMKLSEIISLEPINFEFNNGVARIWDKKRRLYRSVYLTDETVNEIRVLIDTKKDSAGPRLFPYSAKTIEGKFQRHTLKILGKSRSWESVRRTYISISAKLDMPIKIVVENTGELPSAVVKYYMDIPVSNARRKVNETPLFPDSPQLMLKSDELKRILERPYVEKLDRIMADRSKLKATITDL